ncbi:MAG: rRNA (adenine-N6)-dimethyltransferase [Actinomycetota bacterium]|nr:rRNA (adenine-N6)-dimethyltransferase [Actinomycetota bacterium]
MPRNPRSTPGSLRGSNAAPAPSVPSHAPDPREVPSPPVLRPPHRAWSLPGGGHELGQNFLVDRKVIATVGRLVARVPGPVVEFGPGDGALTVPLSASGREITAVELDPRRARRLHRRLGDRSVTVVQGDFLRHPFPDHPHVLVGNIPFHLTTAVLRRIFPASSWTTAILLVQWEVARRRAGIGGATLLTASWWPWYEFSVHGRIPAGAFRPVPGVDGGLLRIDRRAVPLVVGTAASAEGRDYQQFLSRMFTGPGRGLGEIIPRATGLSRKAARDRLRELCLAPSCLPRDLDAEQWASLWGLVGRRQR